MAPWASLLLLNVFCALGVGHGFAPRANELGNPHIVGGQEVVNIKEMPYMASLREFSEYVCGASIIGKSYVLTAAHCVGKGIPTNYSEVAVGTNHRIKGASLVTVRSIIRHPNFTTSSMDYDIAVVQTMVDFNFDVKVGLIVPIDANDSLYPENQLLVSGWGQTSENKQEYSDKLMKTEVYFINELKCKKLNKDYESALTDRMFCAGVGAGGRDACPGDSGSPIVDLKSKRQVGVVSWGCGCGNASRPGVYTKLSNLEIRQFVTENTGKQ